MKILLVQPYGTRAGHFGFWSTHIGQELAKLGHAVVLVTATRLETRSFLKEEPLFQVVELGSGMDFLSPAALRMPAMLRKLLHGPLVMWLNLVALRRALRLLLEEGFDVLHLLDWEILTSAALLWWEAVVLRRRLPPVVIRIEPADFTLAAHRRNPLRGVYKCIARLPLRFIIRRFCRAVIVQGHWHRTRILEQLGLDGGHPPFIVVPPGKAVPQRKVSQSSARKALGIEMDCTVFLFFGMLRREKGIDTLLQAVASLEGDWKLIIAGAPFHWTAQSLKKITAQSKRAGQIWLDIRYLSEEEAGFYFTAADAVVFPYSAKDYPGGYGSVFSACGYGKPLVASDVGDMDVLVRERNLGIAVRPDDPSALRDALETFLHLPPTVKQAMGANAYRLAQECSCPSIARIFSDVYQGRGQKAPFWLGAEPEAV